MTIYTITFNKNDGSTINNFVATINDSGRPAYVAYLASPTGPLPVELALSAIDTGFTRYGFTLIGWSYTQTDEAISLFIPRGGVTAYTVYAQWSPDYIDANKTTVASTQDAENKIVNLALTEMPVPYISGLKLNADIQINGLTLNTIEMPNPATYGATPDPSRRINNFYGAVVWVVSDIDGWWNLPESEIPDLPRGWGDGSYGAIGRYASRVVNLTGSFLPQYPQDAPIARNFLIEAVALVKTGGWLIVSEDFEADRSLISFPSTPVGGDSYKDPNTGLGWSWSVLRDMWLPNGKASYVRLNGAPEIANVNARGRHDFSIGLKAVDPIKYEYVDGAADGYNLAVITADSSGNGQVIVNNSGNVPVPILLELSQGFVAGSASLITNNTLVPQTIKVTGSTAANTALEIDTYNREALLVQYTSGTVTNVANGRANLSVLLSWIYLEPGNNVITVSGFPASATCYVYYRSGWIG